MLWYRPLTHNSSASRVDDFAFIHYPHVLQCVLHGTSAIGDTGQTTATATIK